MVILLQICTYLHRPPTLYYAHYIIIFPVKSVVNFSTNHHTTFITRNKDVIFVMFFTVIILIPVIYSNAIWYLFFWNEPMSVRYRSSWNTQNTMMTAWTSRRKRCFISQYIHPYRTIMCSIAFIIPKKITLTLFGHEFLTSHDYTEENVETLKYIDTYVTHESLKKTFS